MGNVSHIVDEILALHDLGTVYYTILYIGMMRKKLHCSCMYCVCVLCVYICMYVCVYIPVPPLYYQRDTHQHSTNRENRGQY